jgi:excinuclease ABC subunit A
MSENYACPDCNFSLPELEPRLFSFNAPYGACEDCKGLGFKQHISLDLLFQIKSKSIYDGAIKRL